MLPKKFLPIFITIPARHRRAGGYSRFLLAVLLTAAGPNKGVALAAFITEQVGVDWRAEAWIIQLDRDVIAPFGGTFGPAST